MAIICDTHMHSSYSGDSNEPMENMVLKAIDLGLKHICFTEHQDFDFIYKEDEPKEKFEVNTDQYLYDLILLKEKYAGKINVIFGIELGMQSHLGPSNTVYANSHDFDYVIASSHLVNRKDPYFPEYFEGRDEKEAYHEYFRYIIDCLNTCMAFDSYGHLDYILRYGPTKGDNFTYSEYADEIDTILNRLIRSDKALEINTSGYAYKMNNPHPRMEIIKRYKELGGELITVGSDAHCANDIARNFKDAEELLKACGYGCYTLFDKRTPISFKI